MKGFSTTGLHSHKENRKNNPHILPIYAGSSFTFDSLEDSIDVFAKRKDGHVYSRYGNPTIQAVEQQLAALETLGSNLTASCLLTSSGMSAIHVLLTGLLQSGEAILSQKKLYGGTTELFNKVLARTGINTIYTNDMSIESLEKSLLEHPEIKLIYLETPSNPTLECVDIAQFVQFAKNKGLITVLDNTFCTPFHQQGLVLGIDYVIYSTTKYLNGHGNSIAGAILTNHHDTFRTRIWEQLKLTGSTCNAFDAWLIHNGLKTLELRMIRHSENAMALAQYLQQLPEVNKVYYPGLTSHTTHDIAVKQMKNGFGGMLSFDLKGGQKAVSDLVKNLSIATYAPTLGDVDTLIMHPESSSHLNIPESDRLLEGVTPGLLRVSVGIENTEDLLKDFSQALKQ